LWGGGKKVCIDEMAQEWHLADGMAGYGNVTEMIPLWLQVLGGGLCGRTDEVKAEGSKECEIWRGVRFKDEI
jgi:hypothetical protein